MTSQKKFDMFKSKVQKMVEDQDYFSQTEQSESDEDEEENTVDKDKQKAHIFFKKSLRMQKEGTISLLKVI